MGFQLIYIQFEERRIKSEEKIYKDEKRERSATSLGAQGKVQYAEPAMLGREHSSP